jgi:hypothetical protein
VLAAIAVLFVPIVFGGAAIAMAAVAKKRGAPLASIALPVAIGCTVAGVGFGIIVGVLSVM